MGLPLKRSRVITVDGVRYRWVVRYADITWCSAPCPLSLNVQLASGRGQRLVAHFDSQKVIGETHWVFPRYGSEVTPGVVADIIRASLAAGWAPEAGRLPAFVFNGEPFLRLPADPSQPPPGSEDDLKRKFLAVLRELLVARAPESHAPIDQRGCE